MSSNEFIWWTFRRVQVIKTHSDVGLSKRAMKINPNEKERFKISGAQTARMTGKAIDVIY